MTLSNHDSQDRSMMHDEEIPLSGGGQEEESNIETPPDTVDVIAPSDLMEGFRFNADMGGRMIHVEVPKGGVKAGERFSAIVVAPPAGGDASGPAELSSAMSPPPMMPYSNDPTKDPHQIPTGKWRDGLCDCWSHCCNSLCLLSTFATPVATSQVMTRFKMDLLGRPGKGKGRSTFRFVVLLFLVLSGIAQQYYIVGALLGLYFAYIAMQTRVHIREQYQIPVTQCGDCEDVCCAVFCLPCITCQMARHTANYGTHPATCCTATGLSATAPSIA